MNKSVLFLNGIPDDNKVKVRKIEKNGKVNWLGAGSANLSKYLKNDLFDQSNVIFDTRSEQRLPRKMIHAVFNQMSDADSHKIALKKADDFYKNVPAHIPFFNPPSLIMNTTRDKIYQILQGIDRLHVPKTVKIKPYSSSDIYDTIEKEHLEFPVIFRKAGDHGGISTVRVDDKTEQFHAFALDGREYYLTQFVEYADENKIYAKYRFMVIEGEVYLRHAKFSDQWMVHHKTQIKDPEALQKSVSERFLTKIKPSIQPIMTEIYNKLGLDYFGIDCNIDKEMNLLVFEINANMGIFVQAKGDIFTEYVEVIRQALIKMIDGKINPLKVKGLK